ncbi:hypothetical protein IH981_02270, partial [Patescibacteria group bacterium]|nr:hypothetical protein [Patescibacteria group bacterium]
VFKLETVEKLATDCSLGQKKAVELLVDERVLVSWASDEGVVISKAEQKDEELRIGGLDSVNPCTKRVAMVNLLRERLSQNIQVFREGEFIIINFSRFANPNSIQVTKGDEKNRKQKYAAERAYADTLSKSIYSDLKTGKISFEEAIKKVNNDPKVGLKSFYETNLISGSFTALEYIEKSGLLADDSVRQKIDKLNEGEISEPFISQIDVASCWLSGEGCEPQYVDARWIIARIGNIGKGYGGSPETIIEKIRNDYKATIYIK